MIDMDKQVYRLITVPTVAAMQYKGDNVDELTKFIAGNEFDLELILEPDACDADACDVLVARDFDDWSSVVPIDGWITLSESTWSVFSDSQFKQKYELVRGLTPRNI